MYLGMILKSLLRVKTSIFKKDTLIFTYFYALDAKFVVVLELKVMKLESSSLVPTIYIQMGCYWTPQKTTHSRDTGDEDFFAHTPTIHHATTD